jgi:hypothetical protein
MCWVTGAPLPSERSIPGQHLRVESGKEGHGMDRLMVALAFLAVTGCSTVEVKPFDPTSYQDGLRFYRPEPYLLVTRENDGMLRSMIIYLPNKKEEYVVRAVPEVAS